MLQVDLHVHSNRSDGTFSPKELVDYAMEKGLAAFALTDHDTVDGLDEAISYAESLRQKQKEARQEEAVSADAPAAPGQSHPISEDISRIPVPEVIPGIEFSTEYQGRDVHIVGLYIDYHSQPFRKQLQEFVDSRTTRNHKMCRLLQEAGIRISYEALLEEFPDAVITRAHYAKYMLNHSYIQSIPEAFERYVGDHCPCYVPREKVTPVQAVQLVLEAGGIPVLAHPILYRMSDSRLDALTAELKNAGLIGIEAIYSTYKPHEERQIRALAKKYDLRISGGSDFHGSNKPGLDLGTGYGSLFVPMEVLTELKRELYFE
ncbi:MAG: PHP domain-containing protein [Butyrivibrio sp.]|nr:PHP domain-containing protein [Acetatifactor muris]MCM1559963.1 PHP domain-containing protein [Butyrivibrio sp.]